MMMKARKSANIEIAQTIATVWWFRKRPDIAMMLNAIGSREITLGQRKGLSGYLESLGLVKNGSITSQGKEVLDKGMAWVPERGKYRIYMIDDATLGPGRQVIHIERAPPDAIGDGEGKTRVLDCSREIDDTICDSWLGDGSLFRVTFRDLWDGDPSIIHERDVKATVEIVWDEKTATLQFSSEKVGGPGGLRKVFKNYEGLNELGTLKALLPDYDPIIMGVRTKYDKIKEDRIILETMQRDFEASLLATNRIVLRSSDDPSSYEISLKGVVLAPKNDEDATRWATHIVLKEIGEDRSYPTRDSINECAERALQKVGFGNGRYQMPEDWYEFLSEPKLIERVKIPKTDWAKEAVRKISLSRDLCPPGDSDEEVLN